VDADVAIDDRGRSVRQRRVVLTSRCWRLCTWRQMLPGRNGGKRAVLRGEHVISRKPIAQGRPGVHRCPVCSCAAFYLQTAHGTAGAARTRSSLRPLFGGREVSGKARAQSVARSRPHIQLSSPGLTGRPKYPRDGCD
jgi:hypothetical protein